MKKILIRIACCSMLFFVSSMFGCSDQSASKQELIDAYNEFSKNSPPALGEGIYPLTANFSTVDKGKEGQAQALVDIGFIRPVHEKKKPDNITDNVVTFHLTDQGRKFYSSNVSGFTWGYHSAFSISNIKVVTQNQQKIAYVTLKTKIINIPDWAKQPVILSNYPIVKATLANNEFVFNAVYKLHNNQWKIAVVSPAVLEK